MRKNKDDKHDETIYEEVLLRIFAFYDDFEKYQKDITLVKFLNDYCKINQNPSEEWLEKREKYFTNAMQNKDFISLVKKILKTKNNSILEALFVLFIKHTYSSSIFKKTINFNLHDVNINECLKQLPKSATYSSTNVKKRFESIENLITSK